MKKYYSPDDTGGGGDPDPKPQKIPLPDYKDPESRKKYAAAFRQKYGPTSLRGLGDIPLRVNEKPEWASDTSKNLAVKEATRLGLDPALFYSSTMIEGQSGLYRTKNEKGQEVVNSTGDKNYPVSAMWSFGLDSFNDYLPQLKKKGYLPQDFDKNFTTWKGKPGTGGPLGPQYNDEDVMFKTTDAGIQAKAAMMRAFYDELDDYAKNKNIKLTPEQRDFFSLAHFNSGAHGFEMLNAYNKAGLLKNNDFLKKMPNVSIPEFDSLYNGNTQKSAALHKKIYGNVLPRLEAARGLKEEGLFDDMPKGGAPTGYIPLNAKQRGDWNAFLNYLNKDGADLMDQNTAVTKMAAYNKANPKSSITPEMIPFAQYEHQQLRTGDDFAGITGDRLQQLRSNLSPAYLNRDVSAVDGWLGPKTAMQYYPTAIQGQPGAYTDHGTDIESFLNQDQQA